VTTIPRSQQDLIDAFGNGYALVVEENQAFLVEAAGLDRPNVPVPLQLAQKATGDPVFFGAADAKEWNESQIAVRCRRLHAPTIRKRKVYGKSL